MTQNNPVAAKNTEYY